MPLLSKRGSQAVKGFGMFTDFGNSEWLWTYRLNPGPTIGWFPNNPPVVFCETGANLGQANTWITFNTPLSFNTAYFGNWKSAKISPSNGLSSPSSTSAYDVNINTRIHFVTGIGNTSMWGCGTSSSNNTRPALFLIEGTTGNYLNSFVSTFTPAGATAMFANDWAFDLVNISSTFTYFHTIQDSTVSPTRNVFSSITSSTTPAFSKYLTTSASAAVPIYAIKYNPLDGFLYVLGNNGFQSTLLKYSTAGVLQWQRSTTSDNNIPMGLVFSGTNIVILTRGTTNRTITYSNSGTLLSSKNITGFTTNMINFITSISKKYFFAITSGLGGGMNIIVFNSSFDVVRNFSVAVAGATGSSNLGRLIYTDQYDNIYITGYAVVGASAPYDTTQFVIKFPIDSNTNKTYTVGGATVSVTEGTIYTTATSTSTDAAGTLVENAYTNAGATTTWTSAATAASSTLTIQ